MKVTGIILSVLGVGLLITGVVILVKQNKEEKKSGFTAQSGNDWILGCIDQQKAATGSDFDYEAAAQLCSGRFRNRKISRTETKSNACGCGM